VGGVLDNPGKSEIRNSKQYQSTNDSNTNEDALLLFQHYRGLLQHRGRLPRKNPKSEFARRVPEIRNNIKARMTQLQKRTLSVPLAKRCPLGETVEQSGWETLDMVLRYTESTKFEDSLSLYQRQ
jgi:hypothetical protein